MHRLYNEILTMRTLLIHLPIDMPSSSVVLDYVLSMDGLSVQQQGATAWGQWPVFSQQPSDVVLVLPMASLSWHQVRLPQGSLPRAWGAQQGLSRLRAILDGLMEEQLLDEPAMLHLALQADAARVQMPWVVACDRAWLKAWLTTLAAAGMSVKRIVPAHTPEQLLERIHVTGDADQAQLVGLAASSGASSASSGVLACTLSASALALLGDADGLAQRQVLAEPAVVERAEQMFGRPVMLQHRSERMLEAAKSNWDLAQFDLAGAGRDQRLAGLRRGFAKLMRAPHWRPARWSLLGLLLVNLIGLNAWAMHVRQGLLQQRALAHSLLTQTFPNIPVVVDAPVQMAREVEALQRSRGAMSGSTLESMLGSFANAAPANIQITAIDFSAGELRLTGPALNASEQTTLVANLKALGLRAQWQGGQWLLRQEARS